MTRTRTRTRTLAAAAGLAALALALTGCSSEPESAPVEETAAESAWPRTIEVPAGDHAPASSLTLDAEPERIAALDYESAEVIAEIGLTDHLVLIPEAVLNPALGSHLDELAAVESTFPVAMEVDAETVIALEPDLVIMSPRHGNEAPIADVLGQADVPVLQLPDSWANSGTTLLNIDLIGQATGGEEQADALANEIETGLAAAAATSADGDAPSLLVLTNQAGRPFVTAGDAYPLELLELAGAENAAAGLGIDRTGPITAEQIVEADPAGIVLIDMNGTGDRMFTELLSNPAVAAIPAVAEGRMLRVEGKQVQALGLTTTVDGLGLITEWVATL